jgi:hypothetical protein
MFPFQSPDEEAAQPPNLSTSYIKTISISWHLAFSVI